MLKHPIIDSRRDAQTLLKKCLADPFFVDEVLLGMSVTDWWQAFGHKEFITCRELCLNVAGQKHVFAPHTGEFLPIMVEDNPSLRLRNGSALKSCGPAAAIESLVDFCRFELTFAIQMSLARLILKSTFAPKNTGLFLGSSSRSSILTLIRKKY